jgi:hypothetical protein
VEVACEVGTPATGEPRTPAAIDVSDPVTCPAEYERVTPDPLAKVVVATHVGTPPTSARMVPFVPVPKRDEVAIAVGTAEPPVPFAQREFAAIAANEIDALVPPTRAPSVPELVSPVPTESEEVATD